VEGARVSLEEILTEGKPFKGDGSIPVVTFVTMFLFTCFGGAMEY
jgi:hypothetical protein